MPESILAVDPPRRVGSVRSLAMLVRSRGVAIALIVATVVAIVARMVGVALISKEPVSVLLLFAVSAFEVVVWIAASIGGSVVGWLLPVSRGPSLRHAAAVAAFGLVVSVTRISLQYVFNRAIGTPMGTFDQFLVMLLPAYFLTASTFAGLGVGLRGVVRERDLEAAAARMEAELARARMRAMHGRVRPERVLASLDAISRGMEADPVAADRRVVHLGELLRLSLQRTRTDEVTLAEELRYVDAILEMEPGRADRFQREIPSALLDARVPPGIVSTFVEAAMDGGMSPHLTLTAEADGDRLRLRLSDDASVPAIARGRDGVDVLARALTERFNGIHALRYEDGPGGGAVATVEMPLILGERRAS